MKQSDEIIIIGAGRTLSRRKARKLANPASGLFVGFDVKGGLSHRVGGAVTYRRQFCCSLRSLAQSKDTSVR